MDIIAEAAIWVLHQIENNGMESRISRDLPGDVAMVANSALKAEFLGGIPGG
jgi:hypothetical protein